MAGPAHVPVLVGRVTALLAPALASPGAVLVDATLGRAGHARALLEACPGLLLVGIDADMAAIEAARELLAPYAGRVTLVHARYDEIPAIVAAPLRAPGHGPALRPRRVLAPARRSGARLRVRPGRPAGHADGPDRRPAPRPTSSTATRPPNWPACCASYGEERFARRIADAVVRERARAPITSTPRLSAIVKDAIPAATRRTGGNPAKRTFQALRIEVNDELGTLRRALPAALGVLAVGGRVVVLAYHSLEDRIVKRELVRLSTDQAPPGLPVPATGVARAVPPAHQGRRAPGQRRSRRQPARGLRPAAGRGADQGSRMTRGATDMATRHDAAYHHPRQPPGRGARPGRGTQYAAARDGGTPSGRTTLAPRPRRSSRSLDAPETPGPGRSPGPRHARPNARPSGHGPIRARHQARSWRRDPAAPPAGAVHPAARRAARRRPGLAARDQHHAGRGLVPDHAACSSRTPTWPGRNSSSASRSPRPPRRSQIAQEAEQFGMQQNPNLRFINLKTGKIVRARSPGRRPDQRPRVHPVTRRRPFPRPQHSPPGRAPPGCWPWRTTVEPSGPAYGAARGGGPTGSPEPLASGESHLPDPPRGPRGATRASRGPGSLGERHAGPAPGAARPQGI